MTNQDGEDGGLYIDEEKNLAGDGDGMGMDVNYARPGTANSAGTVETEGSEGSEKSSLDTKKQKKRGMFSFFTKEELMDPPLPDLGPPTGYYKIMDRTKKAKLTSGRILELVDLEAVDNIMEGKRVPVHPDKERIAVSADQESAIENRKSKKEIRLNMENNILEIQRNLFWKRTLIEMMNHNFHNVKCRDVPKVDHKESRMATKNR